MLPYILISAMCLMKVWCIIETPFFPHWIKNKHHLLTSFAIFWSNPWISPQIISFKVEFEPNISRKSLIKLCCYYYYSVILSRIPSNVSILPDTQVCPSFIPGIFPSLLVYLFHILHIDKCIILPLAPSLSVSISFMCLMLLFLKINCVKKIQSAFFGLISPHTHIWFLTLIF